MSNRTGRVTVEALVTVEEGKRNAIVAVYKGKASRVTGDGEAGAEVTIGLGGPPVE